MASQATDSGAQVSQWTDKAKSLIQEYRVKGIDGQEGQTCTCYGRPDQVKLCDHINANLDDYIEKLGKTCFSKMTRTAPSDANFAQVGEEFARLMAEKIAQDPLVQETMQARQAFLDLDASKFTISALALPTAPRKAEYQEQLNKFTLRSDPRENINFCGTMGFQLGPNDVTSHPFEQHPLSDLTATRVKEVVPTGCLELAALSKSFVPELTLHYDLGSDGIKCATTWSAEVPALLHVDPERHLKLWNTVQSARVAQMDSDRTAAAKASSDAGLESFSMLFQHMLSEGKTCVKSGPFSKLQILSAFQNALRRVDSNGKHIPFDAARYTLGDSERLTQGPCEIYVVPTDGSHDYSWKKAQLCPDTDASGEVTVRKLTRKELGTLLSDLMSEVQLTKYLSKVEDDGSVKTA